MIVPDKYKLETVREYTARTLKALPKNVPLRAKKLFVCSVHNVFFMDGTIKEQVHKELIERMALHAVNDHNASTDLN